MGTKKSTYRHTQAPRHRTPDNRRATRHSLNRLYGYRGTGRARAALGRQRNTPSTTLNAPLAERTSLLPITSRVPIELKTARWLSCHTPRHRVTDLRCC
jgi:hypothetical protein